MMWRQHFEQLIATPGNHVDDAAGYIARLKDLIKVADDERIGFRWNRNDRISHRNRGHHQRQETEQWHIRGTDKPYGADRLMHRQGNIAEWRIVNRAVIFVRP